MRPSYAGNGKKNNPNDWRGFLRSNHRCQNRKVSHEDLVEGLEEFQTRVFAMKCHGTWNPLMEDGVRKDATEIPMFDEEEHLMWLKRALLSTETSCDKSVTQLMFEHGSDHTIRHLPGTRKHTWFKVVIEDHSVPRTSRNRFLLRTFVKNYVYDGVYKELPEAHEIGFHVDLSTISAPFKFWDHLCKKML